MKKLFIQEMVIRHLNKFYWLFVVFWLKVRKKYPLSDPLPNQNAYHKFQVLVGFSHFFPWY